MATLSLDIPDELAARLDGLSPHERAEAEARAVAALLAVNGDAAPQPKAPIIPLRPFHEFASENEYVAAAVAGAAAAGIDPDVAYGLARGIADAEMGRTLTLDEMVAENEQRRAEWRAARQNGVVDADVAKREKRAA